MEFSVEAPAKINWFLSVVGKREDGFHDIVSAVQCVSLFDSLSFESSGEIELASDLDIPRAENLVYRTAVLLRRHASVGEGVRITLRKNIPAAAGLGGGSSDAAFTLMGLNRFWDLGLGEEELKRLGAEIGSDVPFFIGGPFSLLEGRGERVSRLETGNPVVMLLVKPDIAIPASWAYGVYSAELTKKSIDIKLFCQALDRQDFDSLRHMIFNDLEKGVTEKYHIIAEIKELLIQNGALVASMSGSGSAVFGVFHSEEEAQGAALHMGEHWCRVVRTLYR